MAGLLLPIGIKSDGAGLQNASRAYEKVIQRGTHDFQLFHVSGPNRGIYTVDLLTIGEDPIGAQTIASIDGYSAIEDYSAVALIPAIAIQFTATYVVTFTMATKNASSSSYLGHILGWEFVWKSA